MIDLKKLQYGAAAIALGGALGLTASAGAQVIETDTLTVTVLLESSFDLTNVDDIHLGMVSVATSGTGGDPDPTVGVDTAGARVNPAGGDANNFFFVVNDNLLQEGTYTIANAAPSESITLTIPSANVVDPTDSTSTLTIVDASILETTVGGANGAANGDVSSSDVTLGITTTNTGTAAFSVGATIRADSGATYADGTYAGSMVVNANY